MELWMTNQQTNLPYDKTNIPCSRYYFIVNITFTITAINDMPLLNESYGTIRDIGTLIRWHFCILSPNSIIFTLKGRQNNILLNSEEFIMILLFTLVK